MEKTTNLSLEQVVVLLSESHRDCQQDLQLTLQNRELFKYVGYVEEKPTYLFGCYTEHVTPNFYVSFVTVFKDHTGKLFADYYFRPNRSFDTIDQLRDYITKHA